MYTLPLYELPRNTKINIELEDGSTFVTFHHVDGMYSYCTTEKGGVTHLSVLTPIVCEKGTYSIGD